MGCNIASRYGSPSFLGLEGIDLFVECPDVASFVVVQSRPIDRVGQVIFCKFALTAGVNDGIKFVKPLQDFGGGEGA
jgi:hypothetical protein